jgi:hypothetical protein
MGMDKGLRDRQQFREDFLKLMEKHNISSSTVQFVVDGEHGDYDDFIINEEHTNLKELGMLLGQQSCSLSHSQEVYGIMEIIKE